MSQRAVSNSSCLIALENIGRLDWLSESFETVFIPAAVQDEFGRKPEWLVVKPVHNRTVVEALSTQIDIGESEAIALALGCDLRNYCRGEGAHRKSRTALNSWWNSCKKTFHSRLEQERP